MKFFTKVLVAVLALSSILFIGCPKEPEKLDNVILNVNIVLPDNVNEALNGNRTAVPMLPSNSNIKFKVTAEGSGYEAIDQEDPYYNETHIAAHEADRFKYQLELVPGTWTITVTGYEIPSIETSMSEDNAILTGSKSITVDENGYYSESINVYYFATNAKDSDNNFYTGNVNLTIDVTGTNIAKVNVSGTETDLDSDYSTVSTTVGETTTKTITINANNINAGNYSAVLKFYSTDTNDGFETAVREKINVRRNMVTRTWIKSGKAIYLTEKSGTTTGEADFILDAEKLKALINATVYVQGSNNANIKVVKAPDDTNSGTWAAPMATLQGAIDSVKAKNALDSSVEYNIFIDGEVTGVTEIDCDENIDIQIQPFGNSETSRNSKLIGDTTVIIGRDRLYYDRNIVLKIGKKDYAEFKDPDSGITSLDRELNVTLFDLPMQGGDILIAPRTQVIMKGNPSLTYYSSANYGFIELDQEDSDDYAVLYTSFVDANIPGNTNDLYKVAAVKSTDPAEGLTLLEACNEDKDNDQLLSEKQRERFWLCNPGWYMAFDSDTSSGIIKPSIAKIDLPKIGSDLCTIEFNIIDSNEDSIVSNPNAEIFEISSTSNAVITVIVKPKDGIEFDEEGEEDPKNLKVEEMQLSIEPDLLTDDWIQDATYDGEGKKYTMKLKYKDKNDNIQDITIPGLYVLNVIWSCNGVVYNSTKLIRIN